MIDFHGSTGYGQAFTDSIRGDWGGKPFEDLKHGLDAALQAYPWMDGDRVAALGASYGGYMVNWIAGNWPDRFRCLVNHDGILDRTNGLLRRPRSSGSPSGSSWARPGRSRSCTRSRTRSTTSASGRRRCSSSTAARTIRVVETEGIAVFNALQRRGIPSKFLYFPDENHWVLKPANSILWHDTVLDWLDQWTKGEKAN